MRRTADDVLKIVVVICSRFPGLSLAVLAEELRPSGSLVVNALKERQVRLF
ncbi:hypothetical protein [Kitasatospora purpeofusca]|uniref:hypothetical protein n=1 Tax=Kitasatospora purpeofusca TaxID=67352 RepID=UPI0036D2B0AC